MISAGIQQLEGEDERDYCNRLDDACSRAGNVFSLDEKCTTFEAGLIPEIRLLVSCHREANRRISFLELVQFARAEGRCASCAHQTQGETTIPSKGEA